MADDLTSEAVALSGRHVTLRSMGLSEVAVAIDLVLACQPFTWRGVGPGTPRSAIARLLEEGVLAQFLVLAERQGKPIAVVQAISPNLVHGTAHLTLAIAPEFQRAAWPMEGLVLFAHYLFVGYPLRCLLVELPGHNAARIARGLARVMSLDGTRSGMEWYSGSYRDVSLFSLTRQQFYGNRVVAATIDGALR